MQPQNPSGVPVVIMSQPVAYRPRHYENMKSGWAKQLIVLGSLQIVLGGLSVILSIISIAVAIKFYPGPSLIGHGIWIGIPFVVTGPFGIAGGKRKHKCAIVTFNVMSIISASLTAFLFSQAVPSAGYIAGFGKHQYYYYQQPESPWKVGVAMESLLAIIAVAEAIVAIWSSVVCCKIGACCCDCGGSCCCPLSPEPTQVVMTGQPSSAPQQPFVLYTASNQPQNFYSGLQPPVNPDCRYEAVDQDDLKYKQLIQ